MLAKFIRKIQGKLGLTKSEAGIILFLCVGLLLGGSIKLLRIDKATENYDFSDSDAFFAEASSKIDSVLAAEEDSASPRYAAGAAAVKEISEPVDINSATLEELSTLPGVGNVTAQRIIEYRTAAGKFRTTDELLKVKGIGKKKFERIRAFVKAD